MRFSYEFDVKALEILDLCLTTPIQEKLQDGDGVANEPALMPLGRSVLEMAWFGGIALTSFASAHQQNLGELGSMWQGCAP